MGRKSKFSREVKLKAVNDYNEGKYSLQELASILGCTDNFIRAWIKNFESMVEMAFDNKPKNKSYSKKLKLTAINDYLNGNDSLIDIAKKYGIYSKSIFTITIDFKQN